LPEILLLVRRAAAQGGLKKPFERALHKIVKNIPLPVVAMFVCFHPERAGLSGEEVLQKIEQMREETVRAKKREKTVKGLGKVAVIGSGPAGLTVAHELAGKGFSVTVFEALPEAGGMLRKGIPEYRLPKQALAGEVQLIRDMGVEMKTGTIVGRDISFASLRESDYRAVFVGVGAHKSQTLKVEGVDLAGVMHALDFLWDSNCGRSVKVGENVVVVGGGNVAVDTAETALRLGAKQAAILYRRSREEMPANRREVKEAEEQGVKLELLVSPKRILGRNGKVSAVECVRMRLGDPDETGRRKALAVEGSEFQREADMVILAIGETPDLSFLPFDVDRNEDGTVWVDPTTMATSMEGVFAGGDVVRGPASVIEAIRDGKIAAESIEKYLDSLRGER